MKIVMLTNTFTPHVGGVARSVERFCAEYRRAGHGVLVVAPEFANTEPDEEDVVRIPAIQHFNGSDFSVVLPVSGLLTDALDAFQPDIVHAHHPYLLGMTALRIARYRELPLVFTHHTLYEQYTHYVPGDSPRLQRFAIELAIHYSNLVDQVFAPSESIAELLRKRGTQTPIKVVPTGVDVTCFQQGDGVGFRTAMDIPVDAFVVGHVGRLAQEKNLPFLAESVAMFVKHNDRAHFMIAGEGPAEQQIRAIFAKHKLSERLHIAGILNPVQLATAYQAMDVFAFASKSETQGMVLTEAMAGGVPVVALDASGVREVVNNGHNGRLLYDETFAAMAAALTWIAELPVDQREKLHQAAYQTAKNFSMAHSASKALACYQFLCQQGFVARPEAFEQWQRVLHLIKAEWDIIKGVVGAASTAIIES